MARRVTKIVEFLHGGQIVATVPIALETFWWWSRAPIAADFITEAYDDLWWRKIDLPADVEPRVRDPGPGDPADEGA